MGMLSVRPEGPRVGEGFLQGAATQLRGLGERCKLPEPSPERSPRKIEFGAFSDLKIAPEQRNGIKRGNDTLLKSLKVGYT